ncbi:MAG: TetR/AcrR family transcriptional regulator [Mesorhizobium sp.]|nr:MAG: TetR/AcrR family transcriptional regulator [Mesorhizobium sp.]
MKARRTNSRDKILAAAADVARETGPGSLSLDAVGGESPLATYIKLSAEHAEESKPSASWIFSAIAEDPDFLTPIKSFRRQVFERLKGETPDLKALLVCYLAIEGLRSMNLFDSDVLSQDERRLLVSSLLEIAG